MSKKIILASKSPRRRELLSKVVDSFTVIVSDVDEYTEGIKAHDIPKVLSQRKARDVFSTHMDCVVIGADTVVVLGDEVLTKPEDENDAKEMLKKLSGKEHEVISGCTVISKFGEVSFTDITKVKFYDLTDKEIDDYVKTGEPMDKAGAYGIQGKGYFLVEYINGDYNNVVGLPIAKLKRILEKI